MIWEFFCSLVEITPFVAEYIYIMRNILYANLVATSTFLSDLNVQVERRKSGEEVNFSHDNSLLFFQVSQ